MNLQELPGLITKHVGMLKAAAGEILDNPGFNSMTERQSVWDTVQETGANALDARANVYQQAFGNERGILEQAAGVAGITTQAIEASEQMFPQAAQRNPQTSGQETLGGDVDTARHIGLAARLAQQRPGLGKVMLAAHENFGLYDRNPRESQRDTRNNAQGWMLGENIPPEDIDATVKPITQAMSNMTALTYLPITVMAKRQSVWK